MLKPLSLHRKPGLPPDGSPGVYLGWDATGWPYLLWQNSEGRWIGRGRFGRSDRPETLLEPLPREARKSVIVMHAGPVERGGEE